MQPRLNYTDGVFIPCHAAVHIHCCRCNFLRGTHDKEGPRESERRSRRAEAGLNGRRCCARQRCPGPAVHRRSSRSATRTRATAARRPARRPASPTASSTTGPAPDWSSPTVRGATGSGTQRLYGFRDILVLKVVKRLLDTGRLAAADPHRRQHLRERGVEDLAQITLMSDGASVYECTSARRGHRPRPGRPGRLRHRRRPGLARGRGRASPPFPANTPRTSPFRTTN